MYRIQGRQVVEVQLEPGELYTAWYVTVILPRGCMCSQVFQVSFRDPRNSHYLLHASKAAADSGALRLLVTTVSISSLSSTCIQAVSSFAVPPLAYGFYYVLDRLYVM